ncbi:hypothetical protein DFH06DRAFT_1091372 [Mycena polygramma]|nr:hypothetical protein DFH06DRAFT_1091372 [Mycena polygramma]
MSLRSRHSRIASQHRVGNYVSNDDLFNYALRVSFLSHLMLPKQVEAVTSPTTTSDLSSRLSALSNFSIGDLFKDGPKSVKFPEKLLKILEQKLQNIAMGKDPAYTDQLVRRTMAKFYGQFQVDTFKRQMKESRKIEGLILTFATQATAVLKKEPTLAGDGWKLEVNTQIGVFVRLLRECLRGVNNVSPELLGRLDGYAAKLAPVGKSPSDSGYDSASTRTSISVPGVAGPRVADMELVCVVAALFSMPEAEVQKEVDRLRGVCTQKAALTDLKTCLKNLNAGAPFPGRREDFDSDAAWQRWRTAEGKQLQQLMVAMVELDPELAKSTPAESSAYGAAYERPSRNASIGSRSSFYASAGLDDTGDGAEFTYVPPNPRKFYRRLLERCLLADLEVMLSPDIDDATEVSLGILSDAHLDLLNACATRWRVGHPYRAVCFLELVKTFYERQDIPIQCVPEALGHVGKVVADLEVADWPAQDAEYLATVYGALFNTFVSQLYHAMDSVPNLQPGEIAPYVSVLEHIRDSGLLERAGFEQDVGARLVDVQAQVQEAALRWYRNKLAELQAAPGVNRALPLLFMTDELENVAKQLDKTFQDPILGQIDLVSLVVEVLILQLLRDMQKAQKRLFESSMNGPTPDVPIQDIFALYRRSKTMLGMYAAFCPRGSIEFDINAFFEPYIRQWLLNIDNKTEQWVKAVSFVEEFEAEGLEGHSSSIVDLFDSLRSPIDFLLGLEWEDEYQNARFFTALSKSILKAVELYCRTVEALFLAEMFPRPTDALQSQKSSAWLDRARQLAGQGDNKAAVDGFNFRPESCVKLNNVEAARRMLDDLYTHMQADRIAEVLQANPPVPPNKTGSGERFLFSVKVASAEGLVPLDHSPAEERVDSFVTLSDDFDQNKRLAQTRTILETLDPRWNETFDISVEKPLWLTVAVHDRALVGQYDTVGQAHLCLDPERFGDRLAHDLWMNLDTYGRVLVRVSMESEKDDIQFHFGRAFRSLKRAEGDMLRTFIDKMSPFIQQCLSSTVLKTLLRTGPSALDYNKAISNVTALLRRSSTSENRIPLPSAEKARVRPNELTDVEIEQAISPLFDYLDANLLTLNSYLSGNAKAMVMTRVWKEILFVTEGLLIPPLSDVFSNMKPLSDTEVDVVFKWLKFLRDYFYAAGEGPVPVEILQNQKYRDIISVRFYYDWHTDALMEECVRVMQQSLRSALTPKRAKSVYSQRNLGTIKERKKEKREEKDVSSGETIMRILRMRPGTAEFIAQQLEIMAAMQAEQESRGEELEERKLQRPSSKRHERIPSAPSL